MRAILTLQIPTEDWKRGRILVASSDPALVRLFCRSVLKQRLSELDDLGGDLFDKELALLEIEQLRARLSYALGEDLDNG